jgi:hypothetical protein
LFNRSARKLASDHELSSIRADDVSSQAVVFDNFERMLLEGGRLKASGQASTICCHRARWSLDGIFRARELHKIDRTRGRRVAYIRNPRGNSIIWGRQLQQPR